MPKVFICIIEYDFNQLNVYTLQVHNPLHLKHFKGEETNLK